ncbi:TIGR03915 family putative DNA repair protein [Sphingobacterium mizutaii]|uniref:TIGR03915 family putative DNA repair protein n=1 Tax=Sphingobacterium mizutaii TaxID=1010 RepID=UPI00289A4EC5|nr:TIGR03915 family putative DNA repair protein [Sphingobacterium mizutaii]
MHYIFDGSYTGYLCCIFEAFERKEFHAVPITESLMESTLFPEYRTIDTDPLKYNRVLSAMEKVVERKNLNLFYHNFLSDSPVEWLNAFQLLIELFKMKKLDLRNFGDPSILRLHQTLKKVSRERHRMKAFIRFVKSDDGLYTAVVEPDFNVLPLIVEFFKNRFADQDWLIYDIKRNYGFHYSANEINEVSGNIKDTIPNPYELELNIDPKELEYQHLWSTYFKSTNIEARKNLKLHLRHVPKRYWKYLVEKKV